MVVANKVETDKLSFGVLSSGNALKSNASVTVASTVKEIHNILSSGLPTAD